MANDTNEQHGPRELRDAVHQALLATWMILMTDGGNALIDVTAREIRDARPTRTGTRTIRGRSIMAPTVDDLLRAATWACLDDDAPIIASILPKPLISLLIAAEAADIRYGGFLPIVNLRPHPDATT